MGASNFDSGTLSGKNEYYRANVDELKEHYGFDFVSLGLAAFLGAPLKWLYSAGDTSNRHRRIVLAPGHGVGGIVLKTGKPMVFSDIDRELDPREYSSYPIVFAEDLHSLCALPVSKKNRVVGVLLCAFRSKHDDHIRTFRKLADDLSGSFCGLDVITDDFLDFAWASAIDDGEGTGHLVVRSDLSRTIAAQEDERRRISRELHDGVAQELLTTSFTLRQLATKVDSEGCHLLDEALCNIDSILDELHNISVTLRPSSLDHLGFLAALRSQATVLEKTYGCAVTIRGELSHDRFDRAMETQAYRICQEAMTNASKYSGADEVFVQVEEAGEWISVSVSDYGCGFDVEAPVIRGSGCGLAGMKERANLIGAALEIQSGPHGTRVTLTAPMYPSSAGNSNVSTEAKQ